MVSIQEQFKVLRPEELKTMELKILGAIYREGVRHLQYYAETQRHFKNPELRLKTFDTVYYEQMLPQIIPILIQQGWKGKMTVTSLPVKVR